MAIRVDCLRVSRIHRAVATILVSAFIAHLSFAAYAAPIRVSADVIGLGAYDSNVDGFGLVLDDFDLGAVDPSLSGILLDVTTADDSGLSRINVLAGSRWNINAGKGSLTYSFSQQVSFHFSTGGSAAGPFSGVAVILDDGERTSFTGSAGAFTFFNPNPVDPALTVGTNFVHNNDPSSPGSVGPRISQGFAYGANSGVTLLTMTHEDLTVGSGEGGFQPSGDFHAWIEVADSGEAAVPEPTTLALLGLGLAGLGFRARRKKLN